MKSWLNIFGFHFFYVVVLVLELILFFFSELALIFHFFSKFSTLFSTVTTIFAFPRSHAYFTPFMRYLFKENSYNISTNSFFLQSIFSAISSSLQLKLPLSLSEIPTLLWATGYIFEWRLLFSLTDFFQYFFIFKR